jgi:CheY-like chemotaxis protein
MTSASAVSTLGDPWNRRQSHSVSAGMRDAVQQPMPVATAIPHGWAPDGLAVDDLPRGKVLVVEDEALVALDLQRMLREAGFRTAGPAVSLNDIQRLIERGTIDCALLDLDVNQRTPLPVADLLAFAEVPFAFLAKGARPLLPREHADRPVLTKPFDKADLLAVLERAMSKNSAAANDNRHVAALGVAWPRVFPSL